jgi:hypothetical protein
VTDDGLRAPDELQADHFAIVPEWLLGEKSDVVKLYALLDRKANKDRRLWPGQAALAEEMECSDRHIRRLIARLEELGALRETKRRYNGSTVYTLLRVPPESARISGLVSPQRPDRGVRSEASDRTGETGLSGPGSPPNESHLPRATRALPKRKLPADYTVQERQRQWAREHVPSIDVDVETEAWRDHHLAAGSVFSDWDAAWRKWMRNAVKFQNERGRAVGFSFSSVRPTAPLPDFDKPPDPVWGDLVEDEKGQAFVRPASGQGS